MAQTFSFPNYGLFNATYYIQQNPDVATSWTGTPLQHYIQYGALEGRAPTAWFNADFYRASYTDLQSMNALQLFNHYCNYGYNEGRVPMLNFSNFDGVRYLLDNPDVAAAGYTATNAISHYVNYGEYEGRAAYANNGVVIEPVVNLGETFTLTTTADNFMGTQFNDTFNAPISDTGFETLQSWDSLDGAGGTDTVNALLGLSTGIVSPAKLANIEVINVTAASDQTLNLASAGQLENLNNNNSGDSTLRIINIAEGTDLSLSATTAGQEFSFVASADSDVNLVISDVGSDLLGAPAPGVDIVINNTSGTVNLTSSTQGIRDNSVILLENTDTITTVNVDGDADLTLVADDATLVDATDLTGDLTFELGVAGTVQGGSGDDDITGSAGSDVLAGNDGDDILTSLAGDDLILGGAGDDTVIVNGNLGTADQDTIDGGAGVNLLASTAANFEAVTAAGEQLQNISNIQTLSVTTQGSSGAAIDAALISNDITRVNLVLGTGGDYAVGFNAGNSTLDVGRNGLGGALDVFADGSAVNDALTIINSGSGDTFDGNDIASVGFEALTINTGGVATSAQTIGDLALVTSMPLTTNGSVTVTGVNALTIDLVTSTTTGVLTVDASGLAAKKAGVNTFTLSGVTVAAGAASITGSAGDDIIAGAAARANTIDGGAGADSLTGGTGADSILGGAGNDTIAGSTGADTLKGGAGNDTITSASVTTVSIEGGEGNDLITITAANTAFVDAGADNDTVIIGSTLSAGDTLNGGTGFDTLVSDVRVTGNYAGATNFEVLALGEDVANQNLSKYTGLTSTLERVDFLKTDALQTATAGSALISEIRYVDGADAVTFERANDTDADSLIVGSWATRDGLGVWEAQIDSLTVNNEDTITIVDATDLTPADAEVGDQHGHVQVVDLFADSATTITLTGDGQKEIGAGFGAGPVWGHGYHGSSLSVVDASANNGYVYLDLSQATTDLTVHGATASVLPDGGLFDNVIHTGSGDDVINGSSNRDYLVGGTGDDVINTNGGGSAALFAYDFISAQEGADTVNLGDGFELVVQNATDGTAGTLASTGSFAAGTVLTLGGLGATAGDVDLVNNFDAGEAGDTLVVDYDIFALSSLLDASTDTNSNGWLSGTYNAVTGTFTIADDGLGADTLVYQGGAAVNLAENASIVILVGVDSDNLADGNFFTVPA